jgi:pyruvate dehydrogenase E1 component alpha subunit
MTKTLEPKPSSGAETPSTQPTFSLISNEKLNAIYIGMVKCRMLEQRAATLFQQGKLVADFHASYGREACAVAVGTDLQPEDILGIASGDWLSAFMKGMPLEALFRALSPKIDGQPAITPQELLLRNILAPSTGSDQSDLLLERAAAAQAEKKGAVVAAFLDPLPDSPKQWQKAMAAAAEKKLPIVFVHPSTEGYQPEADAQKGKTKSPEALFQGVPAIGVDAADAVALYRVAYEAITRARQNRGATLLECATVPVAPPSGPTGNAAAPMRPDAISTMEAYLNAKGIEPEQSKSEVIGGFTKELDLATRFLEHQSD